jgi:hypothetical protein
VSSLRDPEHRVGGRVVRVLTDVGNNDSWCQRLVAVEFDQPIAELGQLFQREAPRQAEIFGRAV